MKNNLLTLAGAAALALGLGACAYDPYYAGNTRTAVSVGYGYGHGYGGSSFSTSFFWSTGDPVWGYDPYVRAYYHYGRRAYYDPWLSGYYPVGYRPPVLVGVPHPVGYRHGWCPPPRHVSNVTVVNYRNREAAYRSTNHEWSRNVRYDRSANVSPVPSRGRPDAGNRGGYRESYPGRGDSIHRSGNPGPQTQRGSQSQWGGHPAARGQSPDMNRNRGNRAPQSQWDGNRGARFNTPVPPEGPSMDTRRGREPQPQPEFRPAPGRPDFVANRGGRPDSGDFNRGGVRTQNIPAAAPPPAAGRPDFAGGRRDSGDFNRGSGRPQVVPSPAPAPEPGYQPRESTWANPGDRRRSRDR